MLYFLVIVVGIVKTCTTHSSTGTTLFHNKQIKTDCWTKEELAKLRARKIFNQIIPEQTSPDEIDKTFLKNVLQYYRVALREVGKQDYSQAVTVLRESLLDTIGGHLRSELLPAARLAYYAGYVPYRSVRELHDFYEEIKMTLNTAGQGWKTPPKIPKIANMTVVKITVGQGKLFNPCKRLVIKRDSNACIKVPMPRVDDTNEPTAVALPLRKEGLVSLLSPNSENVLLKYYTTAVRCILRRSPASCRHSDIVNFDNDLWCWMKKDVAPHLMDEKLYAAYGGVLRIAAAVQNYGKVLSRRNLFEFNNIPDLKWGSWTILTEPYLFIDSDWTPLLYVAVVALAAAAICFVQMCYNYVLGNVDSCPCVGKKQEKTFPQEYLHGKCHAYYNNEPNQIKCLSNSPQKTQRIYDYNENFLDVVMSDAEDDCGSSDSYNEYVNKSGNGGYGPQAGPAARSTSPPKIETSIEQLKIIKGRVKLEMRDESAWTDGSSLESESVSSGSSTSRPRDLTWARCVVDSALSHSPCPAPRSKTSTHTEINSYTSTSQR